MAMDNGMDLLEVDLNCELYRGETVVGVVEELPVPGIDLLLGNDLCGERVRSGDPVVSIIPLVDPAVEILKSDLSDAFPICAITRSMYKVAVTPANFPAALADPLMNDLDATSNHRTQQSNGYLWPFYSPP